MNTNTPDNDNSVIQFNSITHGTLSLDQVIHFIKKYLEEKPDADYSLVIGTDSQERLAADGKRIITIISAIVVHRRGFGGRYFWKRIKNTQIHSLREKIYAETYASLDLAHIFVPNLKKSLNGKSPNYNLEIHVDVGEHGATRAMIKEVVGMITGSGYVAKTKPHAYGASYIADKHT